MRLYTFEVNGARRVGAELKGQLIDLRVAYALLLERRGPEAGNLPGLPGEMLSFIRLGEPAVGAARATVEFMKKRPAAPVGEQLAYPIDLVKVLAPINRPGKIVLAAPSRTESCGWVVASKFASSIVGPGEMVLQPSGVQGLMSRTTLCGVMGRRVRNISTPAAAESIFGYTLLNDISASGFEGQPTLAHNFDSFAPLGPSLVTPEELAGEGAGESVEKLNQVVSFVSTVMTLEPGDIVGISISEPILLRGGENAVAEFPGLDRLENRVTGQEQG